MRQHPALVHAQPRSPCALRGRGLSSTPECAPERGPALPCTALITAKRPERCAQVGTSTTPWPGLQGPLCTCGFLCRCVRFCSMQNTVLSLSTESLQQHLLISRQPFLGTRIPIFLIWTLCCSQGIWTPLLGFLQCINSGISVYLINRRREVEVSSKQCVRGPAERGRVGRGPWGLLPPHQPSEVA